MDDLSQFHAKINDGTYPPLPTISSLDQSIPLTSEPRITTGKNTRVKIFADADNANYQDWVDDQPRQGACPHIATYWGKDPSWAPSYNLQLTEYWAQVPNTYSRVYPGDTYTATYTNESGLSTTDMDSLTASLGVAAEGLNASLSATFSRSVTMSTSSTSSKSYGFGAPSAGKIRVVVMWQLVQKFSLVDPTTNQPLAAYQGEGDVDFTDDAHYSGAFLTYKVNDLTCATTAFVPQQADFTAPQ